MRKILTLATVILLCASVARTQQSGIPSTLRVLTDANEYLIAVGAAQTTPISQPTTFSNTRLRTDANGYLVVVISGGTISSAVVINLTNLVTTSTNGLSLVNTTAATNAVPVQVSPRIRLRGNAYNSVSTLSETQDWVIEQIPATAAGATTSVLWFANSINGGALSYVASITNGGSFTTIQDFNAGAARFIGFTGRSYFNSPANGQMNLTNNAVSSGVGFDVNTDSLLKVRTRAQTGYAAVDAGNRLLSGVLMISATAPTVASGGCTTGSAQSISTNNGTAAFMITIGGATCGTTIVLTMPTATTGWACQAQDTTAPVNDIITSAPTNTTSITLTHRNSALAATNFVGADLVLVQCMAF